MKFLLGFCGKRTVLILGATLLGVSLLDLLSIALIFPFLKLFTSPEIIQGSLKLRMVYDHFGFSSPNRFIAAVGLLLAALYLLKAVLKILANKVRFHITSDITFRLSTHLFGGLLRADYALFTKGSASEMVGIVNAHTVHSVICLESWITILSECVFVFLILLVLLWLNPWATLALVVTFGLIGFLMYKGLTHRIAALGQVYSSLNLLVYKFAFSVSNSIKDIKIMGLEEKYSAKFSQIWENYSRSDSKAKTVKSIPSALSELLVFTGLIAACLYLLAAKKDLMDLAPVFGVLAISAMRMLPSFNRVSAGYNDYKYYRNSLVVVEDLYLKLQRNRQEVRHVALPFKDILEVRGLGFSFKHKKVLDSMSFSIPRGSSAAFVGPSGAGKSTLLDILTGLRKADSGEFYLDSRPFDPFTTDAVRGRIGYVPQNVTMIDDSVAFNIAFERDYDKEKMERVINIVRLSQFVAELKSGLDTAVGESGVRISGGQKQRIGIARALYRDPEILIFDEATSSLDSITEREIISELGALANSKTLIMVAHRLTTVEKCDRIYLLDKGNIAAQGTHEELMANSPVYRAMYQQTRQ